MTLRAIVLAAEARQAHDWDMAAMVVSGWTTVDFNRNPFRRKPKRQSGSFDTSELLRMHRRLSRKSGSKQ